MVRTKGDGATTKVVGSKAPRKQLVSNSGACSSSSPVDPSKKKGPSTGLPYCPQPTPEWQKSVKSFFTFTSKKDVSTDDKEVDDDKENEQVVTNDEEEESPTRTKRSKGKQPQKGKTTKKDSKISELSNEIDDKTQHEEVETSKSDEHRDVPTDSDEESAPVAKRRNRIESDEDD
ncbi:hypothetical protein EB796_023315 [Bugula neritina]|uniref:PCNA-associated factor n=1 Tax=Bugula neritina TaxID=10212 RepID=A0A7J7IWU1_BUGNE|nr:hypothetical protein EB796_023315 [Bugula neritina]